MKIEYLPYSNENKVEFLSLVHSLYIEDPEGESITDEKIVSTINFLTENTKNGEILLFSGNGIILGYTILIYYWSNEFGGQIIFIDELYVKNEYRGKKIGSKFLKYLFNKKKDNFKAVFLEVFQSNNRAFDFYIKNGFVKNEGIYLKHVL
ncbi:MAG: GNAT family N-acetyltransferase [Candidatus Sericytochromatia bacterium]